MKGLKYILPTSYTCLTYYLSPLPLTNEIECSPGTKENEWSQIHPSNFLYIFHIFSWIWRSAQNLPLSPTYYNKTKSTDLAYMLISKTWISKKVDNLIKKTRLHCRQPQSTSTCYQTGVYQQLWSIRMEVT